ncbi:16S rRNA processing protein RimM [Aminivibrio pyruvatiphilus]|uniref:Ribosome maturation factor RimM n=1 Tax=Aminivibrio pyruvatiphilus TaxID=1005740 RepID=A0A4R8M6K8_9BACT|nr:16S rRNA processing protein RimM [Aminivibrio pyruvatiphilus]
MRGELKIHAQTDNPARFADMDTLRLYGSDGTLRAELTLLSVRFLDSKGIVVAGTKEVTDRNGAEALVGATVEIFPEERYPLEEGAFWVDDLIGMTVVDHSTGDVLGTVSEVFPAGENDLYVVRDEAGTDHFIPAVREFIAGVDLDRREMRISLIEGLWES